MQITRFKNRRDAGRRLADALLKEPRQDDTMVLALPRGGVPVAAEIARALGVGLDVMVVRKLGHPLQPELAIGAVAAGGVRVVNPDFEGTIPAPTIAEITAREMTEVERRSRLYRGKSPLDLRQRAVILVDDGLATGATMLAAIRTVRAAGARDVTVAVPVGDAGVCARLAAEADRVVCLLKPASLMAIGYWYDDFDQLTDLDVCTTLDAARSADGTSAGAVP
ncbi:MAG: phosphoribosyltransferase family protein [Gemmatimonadota bacterium]